MKTYQKNLSLNVLRTANKLRLPQFTNVHGEPAHSKPDGSDWSPAQWFEAMVGELGELAEVRLDFEAGRIGVMEAEQRSGKEAADVLTYLDLYSQRCLDGLPPYSDGQSAHPAQGCPFDDSHAQRFMQLISHLGQYANAHKKLMRGDLTLKQFEDLKRPLLRMAMNGITSLVPPDLAVPDPLDKVDTVHPAGVHLGEATVNKFNEVSTRVGAKVFLHYIPPGCTADGHEISYVREEAQ